MEEYYWISSSLNEDGSWVDYPITSSVDVTEEREDFYPPKDSSTGEYILLDSYKQALEDNLYKGTLSLSEEGRLRRILFTQRYKEEDREFLQAAFTKLF